MTFRGSGCSPRPSPARRSRPTSLAGPRLGTAAPASTVPDDIAKWQARKPATNLEYAQWILDAEAHGFVKFLNPKRSKVQLESLRDGKPVVGADPADQEIIGGLVISHALIAERATRWAADTSKPKEPFQMGDYIRKEKGGHSTGERVDIGGFDWTGSKGPDQIVTALKALPPDKYGIGLPFQGEFFPRDQWFNPQAKQAVADAEKANKTTADDHHAAAHQGQHAEGHRHVGQERRRDDPAELGRAARLEAQVGRRKRGRSAQERDAQEGDQGPQRRRLRHLRLPRQREPPARPAGQRLVRTHAQQLAVLGRVGKRLELEHGLRERLVERPALDVVAPAVVGEAQRFVGLLVDP